MSFMKQTIAIFLLVLIGIGLLNIISEMPKFGEKGNPAQNEIYERYTEKSQKETGSLNMVSAIITDYRAFDTLGEATVLFATIAAIYATLMSAVAHKKRDNNRNKKHGDDQ